VVDVRTLSDDQLRDKLLAYGDKPGPITACTRLIYESKLARYMAQNREQAVQPKRSGKFCVCVLCLDTMYHRMTLSGVQRGFSSLVAGML
jgi:LEM domain